MTHERAPGYENIRNDDDTILVVSLPVGTLPLALSQHARGLLSGVRDARTSPIRIGSVLELPPMNTLSSWLCATGRVYALPALPALYRSSAPKAVHITCFW